MISVLDLINKNNTYSSLVLCINDIYQYKKDVLYSITSFKFTKHSNYIKLMAHKNNNIYLKDLTLNELIINFEFIKKD